MTLLRRLLFAVSGGAFLGGVFVTPWAMYFLGSPGNDMGSLCSCAQLAPKLLTDMARWQGLGAAGGAIIALVIAIIFSVRTRKRKPPKTALPDDTSAPIEAPEQKGEPVPARPPPM